MSTRSKPAASKTSNARPGDGAEWRLSDLPASEQAELRDRLAQAKRGEDLIDFDEAMVIARRATDRILKASNDAFHQLQK